MERLAVVVTRPVDTDHDANDCLVESRNFAVRLTARDQNGFAGLDGEGLTSCVYVEAASQQNHELVTAVCMNLELLAVGELFDFCIDQLGLLQTSRFVVEGSDLDRVESFLVCDGVHETASGTSRPPRLTPRQIMRVGCKFRVAPLGTVSCPVGRGLSNLFSNYDRLRPISQMSAARCVNGVESARGL